MKIHSYCSHNGMLSDIYWRLQGEERSLTGHLASLPDKGEALYAGAACAQHAAEEARKEAETKRKRSKSDAIEVPIGTPGVPIGSTAVGSGYISHADTLRMRLSSSTRTSSLEQDSKRDQPSSTASTTASTNISRTPSYQAADRVLAAHAADPSAPIGTSLEPLQPKHPRHAEPHKLAHADDEHVATLARNIDAMRSELQSHGEKGIVWPNNVTYFQFMEFMLFPTLVYQLEYPRTKTWVKTGRRSLRG